MIWKWEPDPDMINLALTESEAENAANIVVGRYKALQEMHSSPTMPNQHKADITIAMNALQSIVDKFRPYYTEKDS